ncbi:MAG: hypothetical protein U0V70_08795 [Terriglobia bacterium]
MTIKSWRNLSKDFQPGVKRSLDNRIVFCANCEANRSLTVNSTGTLTCSSCGSESWMYISAPLTANFKEYNEKKAQEQIAVDRYLHKLEHDTFFTPNGAPV